MPASSVEVVGRLSSLFLFHNVLVTDGWPNNNNNNRGFWKDLLVPKRRARSPKPTETDRQTESNSIWMFTLSSATYIVTTKTVIIFLRMFRRISQ